MFRRAPVSRNSLPPFRSKQGFAFRLKIEFSRNQKTLQLSRKNRSQLQLTVSEAAANCRLYVLPLLVSKFVSSPRVKVLRILAYPFALLYGLIALLRNKLYDLGIFPAREHNGVALIPSAFPEIITKAEAQAGLRSCHRLGRAITGIRPAYRESCAGDQQQIRSLAQRAAQRKIKAEVKL